MKTYDSLIDALTDLKKRGYEHDFRKDPTCLYCFAYNLRFTPEQFTVDEVYRFEEDSNPDDNSVLYAVSSHTGMKGTVVDSFGMYAEQVTFEMARKFDVGRL
ncbi:phosphoribosylpyrophosphate synthetase [Chryseolinea sp. T2]|uniref:phosphoribosylpyrophosphate synthetase n=1 Tax=Chryseolinea sp. T2 TaxID=3129255 RepID=UPI003077F93C